MTWLRLLANLDIFVRAVICLTKYTRTLSHQNLKSPSYKNTLQIIGLTYLIITLTNFKGDGASHSENKKKDILMCGYYITIISIW